MIASALPVRGGDATAADPVDPHFVHAMISACAGRSGCLTAPGGAMSLFEDWLMSRLTRCVAILGVLALLSGCSTGTGVSKASVVVAYPHSVHPTMTQPARDHIQVGGKVIHRDARALIEDLDLLFLSDRPTRLSRWHDR